MPLGVVVLAIAAGLVWYLWSRVAGLEDRVSTAETLAAQLDRQLDLSRREAEELRHRSDTAQAQAEDAQREAEREAAARQQAELSREFARERADQAQLDSERAETEATRSRQELTQLQSARKRELDRMEEALGRIAETSRTPLGMVVNLGEDKFLFDFDKADLTPDNRELLSRIAGVLLASHGYRIQVYGHTDDVGDAQYNQQLSERRAQAVRDYLVKAGLPDDIIEAKGFGKTSPRVEAKSNDARRKNRRVEIGVVDTIISYDKLNATEN
jgi:outer membrane protein OmpA-like peptidoglycan-associated protein